jgi:hypothetical protein
MQRIILAVLLPAVLAGTGTAQAQRRHPTGFMLNAHSVVALGTTVRPTAGVGAPFASTLGPGGGVQIGYAFSSRLTAYVGLDLAKQANRSLGLAGHLGLSHLEAGARLSFPIRDPRLRPYLTASVARRGLGTTLIDQLSGESVKIRFSGLSVGAGAGAQYFLSPTLAIDGAVSIGVGKFGTLRVDRERLAVQTANSTTTRLLAGLSWYPSH